MAATDPNPASAPRYWDYVRAAFHAKAPVKGLGHLPFNKIALAGFAILGVANPGFWLLGAALETAYLASLSGNRRFQKVVAARRYEARAEAWSERIGQSVERLDKTARARYRRLEARCDEIVDITKTLEGLASPSLDTLKESGLSQLLWIFLKLLLSRRIVEENLGGSDSEDLEKEIARLKKESAAPGILEDLARSKRATIEILEKRRGNLGRANETLSVIESELNRIEQQVELLREEAAVARSPQILSARIDSVAQTLGETNQWMHQNAEMLGLLSGEAEGPPPPLGDLKERETS